MDLKKFDKQQPLDAQAINLDLAQPNSTPPGSLVHIRKLKRVEGGLEPGGPAYVLGGINNDVSLPLDYTLEGYEYDSPRMRSTYKVLRTKRNDVVAMGVFESTNITDIQEVLHPITHKRRIIFATANSVYQVDYI